MKYQFVSLTNPSWNANSSDMMKKFGIPGTKWPDEGMPPRMVDGIKVWVDPVRRAGLGEKKSSTHRVMCQCPGCAEILSVGRMHQHKCDAKRRGK